MPWMVLHSGLQWEGMLDNYQDLFDPLTWSGNNAVSVLIYCQHLAPLCIVLDEGEQFSIFLLQCDINF